MIDFSYHLSGGSILSLTELHEFLAEISDSNRRWRFALTQGLADVDRTLVTISYTDPPDSDLPNAVSFHFPLLRRYNAHWDKPEMTYVCLHPGAAILGQAGLYMEDGEVKGDFLYDWEIFWEPIERALVYRAIARGESLPLQGEEQPPTHR
jgi:hypothetical protein